MGKITKAIENNDAKTLAKYVVSSDDKLEINEENLKPLVEYLKNEPNVKKALISMIEKQGNVDEDSNAMSVEDLVGYTDVNDLLQGLISGDNGLEKKFALRKQGKTMLFYDNYVLEITPVYLKVSTYYKDSKIFVNDKVVATANENNFEAEVGPYVPGEHTVKVFLAGEYADAEKVEKVDLLTTSGKAEKGKYIVSKYITLNLDSVSIKCGLKEAKLLVNGKDTGKLIKDIGSFGPIPVDGSVKFQAKMDFPWGAVTINEVPVESTYVELKVNPIDANIQESVIETFTGYLKSRNEALATLDTSKHVNLTDDFLKEKTEDIDVLIRRNQKAVGGFKKVIVDVDSFSLGIRYDNNTYGILVTVKIFNDAVYYGADDPVPEPEMEEYNNQYFFVYDENNKKWLVDKAVMNSGDFSDNNTREIVLSE